MLLALADVMSKGFRDYYRNTVQEALIEEAQTVAGKQVYVGYTREYVKVAVSSDEPLENTMVSGMITEPIEAEIYEMKR